MYFIPVACLDGVLLVALVDIEARRLDGQRAEDVAQRVVEEAARGEEEVVHHVEQVAVAARGEERAQVCGFDARFKQGFKMFLVHFVCTLDTESIQQ